MILAIVLLLLGIAFSAFFSGSETGFYRINRVRLVLDGLGGDLISRSLLAMTNRPSIFVATVLVGNNVANYVISFATVMATQLYFGNQSNWPGLIAPVAMAPFLFVYGELAPKNMFYLAPNRMLRACGLPLLICTWLFAPITVLLWLLSKVLERFAGETPEPVQLLLARKQLQQVFDEGHEAGILSPAQRSLAQGMFGVANKPVRDLAIPANRMPRVGQGATPAEIMRLADRQQCTLIPVEAGASNEGMASSAKSDNKADTKSDNKSENKSDNKSELIGFVRVLELYLAPKKPIEIHPILKIRASEPYIAALMRLEAADKPLGEVIDEDGKTIGFVTAEQLSEPLFRGK